MNSDYVQVTQPVQTYYSSVPYRGSTQNMEFSVIRFTTQTFDTEGKANGVLTISLDLLVVHRIMSLFSSSQSPLFIFPQDRERTISFFFDSSGWLLFASGFSDNQKKGLSVDTLRSGLQGDIGRPGFDSAFRPSPLHEKYWTMVASVQSGNSGQLALGPLFNNPSNSGSDLFLNYAPIEFPETLLSSPTIVGGIGCMDTSFMFMSATYEVIMALSVALFTAIVLTLGTFYFLHRRISRPVTTLASAVEKRTLGGDASHLEISPLPKELHHLQHTINTLLLQLQTARNEASIRQEMILGELHRQPVYLDKLIKANQSSVQGQSHDPECGIVGQSQAVLNLRAMIQKAAQVMADVLIIGETGTGKELAAEAIHRSSPRAGGPFISINCGALDENLLLDALFGHVKGAFSEAKTDRKGAFLAASSGTLHLDEIGNASPKVQQALLRALSVRHIRPLGSDQDVPFDARVIAATNVDLLECVKNGTFREDLNYRLAVITISTPPLRQRKEDLPLLVHYFLTETTQSQNKPAIDLSRGALDKLLRYDWPGNIRELKNSMTRAVTFAEGGILLASHIILGNTTNSTASDTPPAYPA
ncbi:MAG: sigma-54-dependent Fis family transcriptional regulator, partial [Desulfovibrionales bacterium]|nr:sigma-54-dependent Fis family transcriptional regulator [Desulfovibrionales bacterium]